MCCALHRLLPFHHEHSWRGLNGPWTGSRGSRARPEPGFKGDPPRADTTPVKGLEKLTSMRLAEVLTQKGVVPAETITDALYIQDKQGEAFVDVLVDWGHIAEWDLARVVVENFQLPFVLAGNYKITDDVKDRVPQEKFFEHLLVPMDFFGDVLTVSMPVLTPSDVLIQLQRELEVEFFPFVGLISENKKVLGDEFGEFKKWLKKHKEEKARRAAQAKRKEAAPEENADNGGWADLFDTADRAVQDSIKKPD